MRSCGEGSWAQGMCYLNEVYLRHGRASALWVPVHLRGMPASYRDSGISWAKSKRAAHTPIY